MANTIRLKRASGSDPGASDLVTGELAVRTDTGKLFTKKDDNSVTEIGVTGNAASADTVDVSGVTTNSALQVLFSTANSGSAKIIAVDSSSSKFTYNPSSNTLAVDTVVGNLTGNVTGNTSGSSGSCTGNAATATALATARTIAGVSFDGSANISLNNNAITNGAGYIADVVSDTSPQLGADLDVNDFDIKNGTAVLEFLENTRFKFNVAGTTYLNVNGGGIDVTGDITVTGTVDGRDLATDGSKLDGIASGATNVTNTNQLTNGAGFITATLTNEQVQDIVGGMVSGNTESGITVTYQDSDGTLDFSVASQTDNNFTTTLKNKLDGIESGATADQTASEILTLLKTVDGSGSGLDADVVDGLQAGSFLRSDANDSASGLITLSTGLSFGADSRCAAAVSTLSDGSTITVDLDSGIHHTVTLGGNRTFGDPSSTSNAIGQSGSIFIVQDGTGGRTAAFHSDYKFAGGTAPTLSTAANAVDRLDYVVRAADNVHCVVTLDVK